MRRAGVLNPRLAELEGLAAISTRDVMLEELAAIGKRAPSTRSATTRRSCALRTSSSLHSARSSCSCARSKAPTSQLSTRNGECSRWRFGRSWTRPRRARDSCTPGRFCHPGPHKAKLCSHGGCGIRRRGRRAGREAQEAMAAGAGPRAEHGRCGQHIARVSSMNSTGYARPVPRAQRRM